MNGLIRTVIYTSDNSHPDPSDYQPLDIWVKYEGGVKAHIYYRSEAGTWGEMLA